MAIYGAGRSWTSRAGSSGGPRFKGDVDNYLRGMEVVMANLNIQLEGIKVRSMKGLIQAAAHIRNETEHTPPLTPVDIGNLRTSWFVVTANRVVAGASRQFEGEDAAETGANHAVVVSEAQGIMKAQTTPTKAGLMLGYSVNYSGFVHEMIGANFNPENRKGKKRRREGAGPKWLESAIKNNTSKIVQIVKDNAQIKG